MEDIERCVGCFGGCFRILIGGQLESDWVRIGFRNSLLFRNSLKNFPDYGIILIHIYFL